MTAEATNAPSRWRQFVSMRRVALTDWVRQHPVIFGALALVFLAAILTRFVAIGAHSLWLDEAITVHSIETLQKAFFQKSHPPLHYTGLWFFTQVFGDSAAALRSFSAIFGVGTVVVSYHIGRQLFDQRSAAVVAALFVAGMPAAMYFSREARMYAMWQFFVALAFYGLLRLRGQTQLNRTTVAIYLGGLIGAQLSHHYAAFFAVPCVIGAFLLLGDRAIKKSRRDVANWFKLHALLIVAAVGLFVAMAVRKGGFFEALEHIQRATSRGKPGLELSEWVHLVWFTNWVHRSGISGGEAIGLVLVLLLAVACVALAYERKARARTAVALALMLAIPLVAINWPAIRNYTRLYLPVVTFLGIALGYVCWLPVRAMGKKGWVATAGLVFAFGWTIYPKQRQVYALELEPWNQVCQHLKENDSGNDGVFISARSMTQPLVLCYEGSGEPTGFRRWKQIRGQMKNYDQVWLIYSHAWSTRGADVRRTAMKQMKKEHRFVKRWKPGKMIEVFRYEIKQPK